MTAHAGLQRSIAFGVPALVLAASCVPQAPPRAATAQPVPPPDAKTLLKRLALDVPDVVVKASPLRAGAADVTAAPVAAPAFLAQARSPQDFSRAQDCLTAAIYYEARSQSEDGQRAVAQVVLNRVRDLAFPNSVCGVVYQGSNRRTGCQFSFTCDGSMYARRDPWAWERAREIAAAALGGQVYAPVGSATHYHAAYVSPWWAPSLSRIAQIGAHIFYRWQNGMERALAFRQTYAGVESAPSFGGGVPAATAAVAAQYGSETVLGVTIHRGPGPEKTAAADAMPPSPGGEVNPPRLIRTSSFAGVRVHYGKHIPAVADGELSATAESGSGGDGTT